jgi:hypothetical protein
VRDPLPDLEELVDPAEEVGVLARLCAVMAERWIHVPTCKVSKQRRWVEGSRRYR